MQANKKRFYGQISMSAPWCSCLSLGVQTLVPRLVKAPRSIPTLTPAAKLVTPWRRFRFGLKDDQYDGPRLLMQLFSHLPRIYLNMMLVVVESCLGPCGPCIALFGHHVPTESVLIHWSVLYARHETYVCVCVCMYLYTYIHIHVLMWCMQIYVHICICTCIHMHMHTYVCMCCVYVNICLCCICVYTCLHLYVRLYACMYVCMYVCVYVCVNLRQTWLITQEMIPIYHDIVGRGTGISR